jgi:hypothetical protein
MDVVLEKTVYAPGETIQGRCVVPKDFRGTNSPRCFPRVRVRIVGEEYAQVDLDPKCLGQATTTTTDQSVGGGHIVRDTQVILDNEVTVSRAASDDEIPSPSSPSSPSSTKAWTYPFAITLPEELPGTRTFRKPHATGNTFDSCQIRYVLQVSLPPHVPKTTSDSDTAYDIMSLSAASELLESSIQVATDMMREACVVDPSSFGGMVFQEEKSDKDKNPKELIPRGTNDEAKAKTGPAQPPEVEEVQGPWHTLRQTWNVNVQTKPYSNPTTVIELQVGPRKEVPQEVCLCGLLEYTRATYPLVPVNGPLFEVSGGQTVVYTLTDPHGNLKAGSGTVPPDVFVLQAKLSQTIHWAAEGHSIIFPVRKDWKMPPTPMFTGKRNDLKTTNDSHELVTGKLDIPSDLADTYAGKLVDVENQIIFSLLMEKENTLVGTTPGLVLSTRGRQ